MGLWLERLLVKGIGISTSELGSEISVKDRKNLFNRAKTNIRIVTSSLPSEDDIEKAQNEIVKVTMKLADEGKIFVSGGKEEDEYI